MNITIKTIPHDEQRYETSGDWIFTESGDLEVRISDIGDRRMEFLVGLHEIMEAMLCFQNGIAEEVVTQFDVDFEKNRGPNDYLEPGDSPAAPYHEAHRAATALERMAALILDVPWDLYEQRIGKLKKEERCTTETPAEN